MRTLLLTSAGFNGVKDEIIKIFQKPANQIKLAHIITASKAEEDRSYVRKQERVMTEYGIQVEDVDIEGKNEQELREILKNKDVIYVEGGNTFYLLKYVRESGFDKVVKELINKGIIYIGVSAGSYVACPTIEMATWKHADNNVVGLTDLTGMNLVPFLMSVHYEPQHKDIIKSEMAKTNYPVKILTDQQALLVKDEQVELVGVGPEINL